MSAALEHDIVPPTTERMDKNYIYVYNIPDADLTRICYFLDQNDVWKDVAYAFGYIHDDCIVSFHLISFWSIANFQCLNVSYFLQQFKQLANIDRKSPTEVLISHCGDQNRTTTELFMVLYR